MWCWRLVIGLASIGQVVAGLAYFTLARDRETAPFGLALCAGIGLLAVGGQVTEALVRVAIGANVMLALLTALGVAPLFGIALANGDERLAPFAIGGTALAVASAGNAVGLWRLSSRTARHAPPEAAREGAGVGNRFQVTDSVPDPRRPD